MYFKIDLLPSVRCKNICLAIFYLLILVSVTPGCRKFVEIDPPLTQLVTASTFKSNGAATSAVTGIYTQMYNNQESFNISITNGLLSDELTNYSTTLSQVQVYKNMMTAQGGPGSWINAYSYIYQTNAVIEALTNNSALYPAVVRQLTGESKFIRAFWYFYLSNCYGDVPLIISTEYTSNATMVRTSKAKVVQQIISDLKDAEGLLNTNYVDATDTAITLERVRPTKWAAAALLAKVYLYNGNYAESEEQASSVIDNSSLYSLNSLDSVFLANSNEAIWQISTPLPTSINTLDGMGYILQGDPDQGGPYASTTISPFLLNSFESGDNRASSWINTFSGTDVYQYPFKYKSIQTVNDEVTEYTMVLRLGEQYLIRAEAEAQQNKLTAAAADLDVIRDRAGLSATPDPIAADKDQLLAAIFRERQVELFTEWGNRWFDLIRSGNINSVMGSPGNVSTSKGGSWAPTKSLYPIPQSERTSDPNLSQNQGY